MVLFIGYTILFAHFENRVNCDHLASLPGSRAIAINICGEVNVPKAKSAGQSMPDENSREINLTLLNLL